MFLYGATKYAMSADNPGGRKQGKDIIIHAIIGGIIFALWAAISVLLNIGTAGSPWGFCP
jgi:hypothetical protein